MVYDRPVCRPSFRAADHDEKRDNMNSKIKSPEADYLFQAILQLKDMDECYKFFEDLCTVTEIKAMSQRIVVAKMLSEKYVYSEIVRRTGASTATISRVNRSLEYGCDAYPMVFSRLPADLPLPGEQEEK